MNKKNNDNLILIDKPIGITSFDVIRRLRKKLGVKKMGHSGTLDPRASGLMLIGIGEGTKKLKDLIGLPKVYIAEILFGIKTDTGDFDSEHPEGDGQGGKIIEKKEGKDTQHLIKEKIKESLKSLIGDTVLEVSLYSAMKRKGKPLYKYARAGVEIIKPKRVMTVYKVYLIKLDKGYQNKFVATVEFKVGSGTYIRSLSEELGKRLGTVATLQNLRRISIGDFKIKNAEEL